MKMVCYTVARRACFFNFLEASLKALIFEGHPATAGPLSRKLKEKFLCDLSDSSETGGEFMSNDIYLA